MSPDAIIARQIQLSVFLDQSINFASKLQTQFKSIGRHDRGVKQAGFLVLYKTTMPSVLIETGFLTNAKEEIFLRTSETQKLMSYSMFQAFKKYKNELEGIVDATDNGSPFENNPTNKEEEGSNSENLNDINKVDFRIQIETSRVKIPLTSSKFNGYAVSEYQQDGLYKYTIGHFVNNYSKANETKKTLRTVSYTHLRAHET